MTDQVITQHSQDHSIPYAAVRSLTLDLRLSPLDRNCWHVMHMLRSSGDLYPLAGMGQLRSYLTSTPYGKRAAFATAWRALTVLRLTGWVSLVGQYCDPLTGKVRSELYRVNEYALDFHEASALDPALPALLDSCSDHESNQIRSLAKLILATIEQPAPDPEAAREPRHDNDDPLPSGRSAKRPAATPSSGGGSAMCTITGTPQTNHPQIRPNESGRTYKTYLYRKERTYRAPTRDDSELRLELRALPPCLTSAKADQQRDVLTTLKRLSPQHRQDVLDELEARSQTGTVRNVVAYFFALVKRALAGEFHLWAGRKQAQPAKEPVAIRTESNTRTELRKKPIRRPTLSEIGRPHISNIRKILTDSRSAGALAMGVLEAMGQ